MKSNTIQSDNASTLSRRSFLKNSTLAAGTAVAATNFPFVLTSHAAPDDPIRIGLIGCGGRGSGAVLDALGAETNVIYPKSGYHTEDIKEGATLKHKNISVVALADAFPDRIESCRSNLGKLGLNVPSENCFTGFDAYKKVLAIPEINYVIHATPPHFRPVQLKATIEAGKHCFKTPFCLPQAQQYVQKPHYPAAPAAAPAVSRPRFHRRYPACLAANRPMCAAYNWTTTFAARFSASRSARQSAAA